MKVFNWNKEKNEKLKSERNISFEEIVFQIQQGKLIDERVHKEKSNQKIYLVELNNYIYIIPFVESENEIFLKTIFPSRKMTKDYLIRGETHES